LYYNNVIIKEQSKMFLKNKNFIRLHYSLLFGRKTQTCVFENCNSRRRRLYSYRILLILKIDHFRKFQKLSFWKLYYIENSKSATNVLNLRCRCVNVSCHNLTQGVATFLCKIFFFDFERLNSLKWYSIMM
jgi:hypothetical protein